MGYIFSKDGMKALFKTLSQTYLLYAPKRFKLQGEFSDTDSIRYGQINEPDDIELSAKSLHSFKEVLLPISETLFFFTEETVKEAGERAQEAIVFLRSCDLHAVKRLDQIYLKNGGEDSYYNRLRSKTKFILLGCNSPYENCFCVDMGTNKSEDYDASLDRHDECYYVDCKNPQWNDLFSFHAAEEVDVEPAYVTETPTRVKLPENLDASVAKSAMWDEYDSRCIACGRCNFSCPTCTCFSMQDIFYTDNGKVGERRRVWASCMVDGFTDVAGGGKYRLKHGQRMRFKALHKVLDFKQRFGYAMCVGCGRCDDVCPEYISFSHALNKLEYAMQEVKDK